MITESNPWGTDSNEKCAGDGMACYVMFVTTDTKVSKSYYCIADIY
jgi:hypothetical protein